MTEHSIQYQIVQYLRLKNILVFESDVMSGLQFFSHTDGRRFAFINHHKKLGYINGQSDLVIVTKKEVLFVELKTATGKQSPEQKIFQKNIEVLGYKYLIWKSLDDCLNYHF